MRDDAGGFGSDGECSGSGCGDDVGRATTFGVAMLAHFPLLPG